MGSNERNRAQHVRMQQPIPTSYYNTPFGYDAYNRLQVLQAMTYYPELQNAAGNAINPEILPGRVDAVHWNRTLSATYAVNSNVMIWDPVNEVENLPSTADPNQAREQWLAVPVSTTVYGKLAQAARMVQLGQPGAHGQATKTASDSPTTVVAMSRAEAQSINNQAASGSGFFSWVKKVLTNG